MIHRRGFWVRVLVVNAAAALVATFAFSGVGWQTPLGGVLRAAWPSFIVSTIISSLCAVVLSWLAPILYHRLAAWLRWMILVAVLIALAAVGTLLAVALVSALGYGSWNDLPEIFIDTLKTAVAVTLVFGIFMTVNQALRSQLDETALALRTKERDEAEARRVASEAQLASLESRVNPHFFFNTLNSIAALTRDDPAGAERMTTQLASLMRSALDHGSVPLVPLEQEVGIVRDYLEIEQTRFGNRLRYTLDVAEDARQALVPRLSLQTLVENSVKYAVSPRREGAAVSVTARAEDSRVHVEVADDGPGFDVAAIPEGHGLALLRARLALSFGADATLDVNSRPGRTSVALDLPRRRSVI